ncbi:Multidrug resistance protein 1 [Globodera pallida]|nr:Multidrug resistance protein 1 [Globodera pallida]
MEGISDHQQRENPPNVSIAFDDSINNNDDTRPLLLEETEKAGYGSMTVPTGDSFRPVKYWWKKKSKLKTKQRQLGIFAYSSSADYALIVVGTTASVLHGAGFPLLSIVLGGMTSVFLRAENSDFAHGETPRQNATFSNGVPPISKEQFQSEVAAYSIYYLLLGLVMLITSYIQIACWEAVAERVVHRLRQTYLKALLRQEIAWFDTVQSGNLTARLSDDLERVREGLGDKASMFIQMFAAFIAGFVVGFFYNWQMALVMALFTPAIALTGAWMGRITATRTQVEQDKYAVAGAIAEETKWRGMKKRWRTDGGRGCSSICTCPFGFGVTHIITHASYAFAFWFASRLIVWDESFDRGTIFIVFFSVMSGSTALGAALPSFASISSAKGAARHVLSVINRKPRIDAYSNDGQLLRKVKGEICFKNVRFAYPLRREIEVLKGVSFKVSPGRKLALVGPSGCGKSTVVNLLLRFYDPTNGEITLDEMNLQRLNIRSLRDEIGVVSQEPILFDGTLEENILLGSENATREQVIQSCRLANAFEFINKLSDGIQTRVGERGAQLSGGQKQRIAIARALIKNPSILLLDEATSALDTESEALVQKALDMAQEGRTTIVVAHRLATIRNVDQILVFDNGQIVESGTHEELVEKRGIFYEMVTQQQILQRTSDQTLQKIEESPDAEESVDEEAEVFAVGSDEKAMASPLLAESLREGSVVSAQSSPRKGSSLRRKHSPGMVRRRKTSTASLRTSASTDVLQISQMQKELDQSEVRPSPISKIFRFNTGNWHFAIFGFVGCSISGLAVPFFALVYAQIFAVFSEPLDKLQSDAIFWSGMFLLVGFLNAFGFFISANTLGRSGEALTKKLRMEAFSNLMRQDIGFYDDERHNTGKLCTRFATDTPNVRYVFTRLTVVISSVVTLLGAIAIGFLNGWQLALILLAIIPLILASGYFEMQQQFGKKMRDTELLEEAGKVASEAVENIRTVQSLNKQMAFHNKYAELLLEPHRANMVQVHIYGIVFAFSQSLIFFMYALAFWVGSLFVLNGSMSPTSVFRVFFAIAFCGQSVGQISSFIPDVVKARLAASLLFHLIEYPSLIDSLSTRGLDQKFEGNIQFRNVSFAYPSRPDVLVLNRIDFDVKAGQTVALVGYSGCGKSTVMALLERFYSPLRGSILIDGVPIEEMNIHRLRTQICMVSQEPILFDCTIRENITYGMADRERVTHEQIVRAAEQANVHNFVLGLPEGAQFHIRRGTQLSGGQKQRIAIARALIREPTVLLLDEATSALDTENEMAVKKALENARRGRTCLVIAHRLSTIQNSDLILVVNDGRVVEQGVHDELLDRGGIYKAFCETQILKEKESD